MGKDRPGKEKIFGMHRINKRLIPRIYKPAPTNKSEKGK